jgi:hypothetical protein
VFWLRWGTKVGLWWCQANTASKVPDPTAAEAVLSCALRLAFLHEEGQSMAIIENKIKIEDFNMFILKECFYA